MSPTTAASAKSPEVGPVTDRWCTVPNLFSLVRLALVPVFAWLAVTTGWRWQATALLAAMGATDFCDGWIARRFGQVSSLGAVLDPVADRLLLATAMLCSLWVRAVPLWVGAAVLVREAVVVGGAALVLALGGRRVEVARAGKVGAFALMVALPAFLAATAPQLGSPVLWRVLAWSATAVGLGFGYWSLVGYAGAARSSVRVTGDKSNVRPERG